VRLITSASEFLQLVKQKYGSISEAFHAIDEDHSGVLSIIEVRDCIEQLLGLVPSTRVALHCVRALFRELDQSRDGQVSLEEFECAGCPRGGKRRSQALPPRRPSHPVQAKVALEPEVDTQAEAAPALAQKSPSQDIPQVVSQEEVQAPLYEAVQCVVRLLSRTHWEMRHRLLLKEMAGTDSSDSEGLARIRHGIDRLKAEVANNSGGEDLGKFRFWAFDAVDTKCMTFTEFDQLLTSSLMQSPEYSSNVFRCGPAAAQRIALLGWEIEEIFMALDENEDGAISVAEWEHISSTAKS